MVMPSSSTINNKRKIKISSEMDVAPHYYLLTLVHMIPLITLLTLLVTDYDTVSDVV